MLTRLLQAIAITFAVYLTMMTHHSSHSPSGLVSSNYSSAVRSTRLTQLLAEMLDLLLSPAQRGAAQHSANLIID